MLNRQTSRPETRTYNARGPKELRLLWIQMPETNYSLADLCIWKGENDIPDLGKKDRFYTLRTMNHVPDTMGYITEPTRYYRLLPADKDDLMWFYPSASLALRLRVKILMCSCLMVVTQHLIRSTPEDLWRLSAWISNLLPRGTRDLIELDWLSLPPSGSA